MGKQDRGVIKLFSKTAEFSPTEIGETILNSIKPTKIDDSYMFCVHVLPIDVAREIRRKISYLRAKTTDESAKKELLEISKMFE